MNVKYKEGSLIAKYLSKFQDIVNQLVVMKIMLNDELQVLLFSVLLFRGSNLRKGMNWIDKNFIIILENFCYL